MAGKVSVEQPLLAAVKESGDDSEFGTPCRNSSAMRVALYLLGAVAVVALIFSWQTPILSGECTDFVCVKALIDMWKQSTGLHQPRVTYAQSVIPEGTVEGYSAAVASDDMDFLEQELKKTDVPAEALKEVLSRGEVVDSSKGSASFLVAEIEEGSAGGAVELVQVKTEVQSKLASMDDIVDRVSKAKSEGLDYLSSLMKDESGPTTVTKAAPGTGRKIYIREFVAPVEKVAEKEASWVVQRIPGWKEQPVKEVPLEEDAPAVRMTLRSRKMAGRH